MTNDAEAVESIEGSSAVLLTCEHASERVPSGFRWPEADAWLRGTHWAFDLGAAALCRELAASLAAPALLSRFSRLLVDPNRPEDSDTLFRDTAEGRPVHMNRDIDASERRRRLERLYRPYHRAVAGAMPGKAFAFSVHSFTPLYEGQPRELEVGVLFDEEEARAAELLGALREAGYRSAPNEPYSGKRGLMYCVDHHGREAGVPALEIEVRQDLLADERWRAGLVDTLTPVLRAFAA
ncbi:MAG: N-formylglutamate amidohydrolase [Myxococcota bacterium]